MGAAKTIQTLTVYNRPFFVNEMLAAMRPDSISPQMFAGMVASSRPFDRPTLLTAMTRQVDSSGLVPNLAGTCTTPQEVLEMLTNLGHQQLLKISRLDADLQEEIFETLTGGLDTSLRALLVLDEYQQAVIQQLREIRRESPVALALRQAMEETLNRLYQNPDNLLSLPFDHAIRYTERAVLFEGEPRICYPVQVVGDAVVEVWQYYFMPAVEDIHLAAPYQRITAGEILQTLTPQVFKRRATDNDLYKPQTPSGFIGLLGKVGGALPRILAAQVRKNSRAREQVLRDADLADALSELFSH